MKKVSCVLLVGAVLVTGCTKKSDAGKDSLKQGSTVSDVLEQKMQEEKKGDGSEVSPTKKTEPSVKKEKFDGTIDVDLTQMSSTIVYSEVYNMMYTPSEYRGKAVKMQGQFTVITDETTGNMYYLCLIADATACCQQGMEFVLNEDYVLQRAIQ